MDISQLFPDCNLLYGKLKRSRFPSLVHMLWFARDVLNTFKAQCRCSFTPNTKESDLLRVLYKTCQTSNPLPHQLSQHQSVNC